MEDLVSAAYFCATKKSCLSRLGEGYYSVSISTAIYIALQVLDVQKILA